MEKRPALGKGLSALIPDAPQTATSAVDADIDRLAPNDLQPRVSVDDARLRELAESIKANGIIQPIVVRRVGDRFQIIAGERRWRAAKLAGLARVPISVRDVASGQEQSLLEMALIENIQREDLNPLEEAQGLQRLASEFGLTHQDIAEAIGRSRAAVTNALRLLNLSPRVQQLLAEGKLDMGHARALLALEGRLQDDAATKVAELGLSVRETEQYVQELLDPIAAVARKPAPKQDRDVERYAEELSERLGTQVELKTGRKGSGKLIISFTDHRHLESLLARLG